MGDFPSAAALRRFSALSMQNLLYLQAELRQLEVDLRRYAEEDESSPHADRKAYSCDWFALKDSCEAGCEAGNDGRQWRTAMKIREKLGEYETALLRRREINKIRSPTRRDLEFLNHWMSRTDMGNVYLHGEDRFTWSEEKWKRDLLSLETRRGEDVFFKWVHDILVGCYHHILGRHIKDANTDGHLAGTLVYDDDKILQLTRILATAIACVLPVASIAVLYVVQSMIKRLGLIAFFTVVFSLALILTTNAGMVDIFAATAAYAAVLVVFIGTSGPSNTTLAN